MTPERLHHPRKTRPGLVSIVVSSLNRGFGLAKHVIRNVGFRLPKTHPGFVPIVIGSLYTVYFLLGWFVSCNRGYRAPSGPPVLPAPYQKYFQNYMDGENDVQKYVDLRDDFVRTWIWSRLDSNSHTGPTLHWASCKAVQRMGNGNLVTEQGTLSSITKRLGKPVRCCGACYELEEMARRNSEGPTHGEPRAQPDEIGKNETFFRVPFQPPPEVEHANLLLLTEPDHSTSQAAPRGKK